jgi:hypothetical protein
MKRLLLIVFAFCITCSAVNPVTVCSPDFRIASFRFQLSNGQSTEAACFDTTNNILRFPGVVQFSSQGFILGNALSSPPNSLSTLYLSGSMTRDNSDNTSGNNLQAMINFEFNWQFTKPFFNTNYIGMRTYTLPTGSSKINTVIGHFNRVDSDSTWTGDITDVFGTLNDIYVDGVNAPLVQSEAFVAQQNSVDVLGGRSVVLAAGTQSYGFLEGASHADIFAAYHAGEMDTFNSSTAGIAVGYYAVGDCFALNTSVITNCYGFYSAGDARNRFNGGVRIATTVAKPTCSVSERGTFWVTQSGAGVKDSVEVCAKDAANVYSWRTIY